LLMFELEAHVYLSCSYVYMLFTVVPCQTMKIDNLELAG
jgi:hypothetical protein